MDITIRWVSLRAVGEPTLALRLRHLIHTMLMESMYLQGKFHIVTQMVRSDVLVMLSINIT
jgi:wyosine [tRNA(Phe)-imidazoG37] synthetase (radical SAM superfamily)